MRSEDLINFNVSMGETDLFISAEKDLSDLAGRAVAKYRKILNEYQHKAFFESFKPVPAPVDAHPMIRDMSRAAEKSGTGPMASVAGAIAEYTARDLAPYTRELIIENGGDIYIRSTKSRRIKIFAGESRLSNKITLEIRSGQTPMGICTSSGTVGHSFSFGNADAVVVLSPDTILADALATAGANIVKTPEDIDTCIQFIKNIEHVTGVLIIIKDKLGLWGDIRLV
jgi:uncharacterized protein